MKDDFVTPVLFRIERRKDGEVTAVFPCEPWDRGGLIMSCYAHVGQHGGCSFGWYNSTKHRAAKPEEYAALKAELEAKPYEYNLKVYKRMTRGLRDKFEKEFKRLRDREFC